MRKQYILDTSTLIYDPCAYKQFLHSDVIIPITVLNELDNLKKQPGDVGKNARISIKLLDEISNTGDISTGVLLNDSDIVVKIDAAYYDLSLPMFAGFGNPDYGDTQILACMYANWREHPTNDVSLVSNDINLRVKAKSRGIDAIAHEGDKPLFSELYSGIQCINDEQAGLDLQNNGFIDPETYGFNLFPHECVLFENASGDGIAQARKVSPNKLKLIKKHWLWGISPRNKEQSFAMDLIMDESINLVTLIGRAGTGKSLVALAASLDLVCNKKKYDKFVIYRPIQSVGNEIGFLPGTMEEKLAPWFQAIMDNLEALFSIKNGDNWKRELDMFQRKGLIEMEAITYIRGRSIPNSIILVDECQNLSKEDVKTILTRAGENTKIILTGDIEQIDNSKLDATSNGLTYVIEKFKDLDLAGHITFVQGERSRLASIAAEIL
jgi:PhoH-like ATPase